MSDRIFLVADDGTLKPMDARPYGQENVIQALLESYPDVLAGDQMDGEEPKRWLLVRREASIEHRGTENHTWWLDHLFIDQDGVPTLVETKIAENPELRRKVVGQMMDYAANFTERWPLERIQAELELACEKVGRSLSDVILEHVAGTEAVGEAGLDQEVGDFWKNLKSNLDATRLRLLFVADHIPSSLTRVVEFLNEQMDPCEVLAVEIRQYLHDGEDGTGTIRTLNSGAQ